MIAYFLVSCSVLIASCFVFRSWLVLNPLSLAPAILILVSLFQALIFRYYANAEKDELSADNTAYSMNDLDFDAYRKGMKWHSVCKAVIIPPLILFAIFFSAPVKVIGSILLYVLSYFPVKLLVRLEQKKEK